ncbi:MAG: hypothetical protein DRJ43_00025 [Thermoprotei archaeon]|nr:MAG: hypothetical protein DRJ43_00025 [Thermoprotei archaeon]RLG88547.1 MAG: hypothetical protein DRO15_02580 [Thermoprotei archaeon]
MTKRVAIIGLDGFDWCIMSGLLNEENLPYLSSVGRRALKGILVSTIPYITPVAWTSMVTGVEPWHHGVYDFFNLEKTEDGTFFRRPVCLTDVKHLTIWDLLSKHDKSSIVIEVPPFYPARKIKGIMISGFPYPKVSAAPLLIKIMVKKMGYRPLSIPQISIITGKNRLKAFKYFKQHAMKLSRIVHWIIEEYYWDFFMTVFIHTDTFHHYAFHKLFQGVKGHKSEEYNIFIEYMKIVDEVIAHVLDVLRPGDLVLLVSDHGNRPITKSILINNILRKGGFLYLKKSLSDIMLILKETFSTSMKNILPLMYFMHKFITIRDKGLRAMRWIDMQRAIAFAYSCVSPSSVIQLMKREYAGYLMNYLLGLEKEGRRLFKNTRIVNDKMIIEAVSGYTIDPHKILHFEDIMPVRERVADHRPEGILIAYMKGRDVNRKHFYKVGICDIAPTTIDFMGISCDIDEMKFDGRSFKHLLLTSL